MSEIITTLHKKDDTTVDVYPNIKGDNIPSGAITTAKINDGAVTYDKLSESLKSDVTNFNNIYDTDNDKINVTNLNVTDDINCTNINVTDIETTNSITSDSYYDGDNDEIKVIVNHSMYANLVNRDDPSDTRYILIHFLSSKKESITTFSELLDELNKKIGISIIDNAVNVIGWISEVNINNGYVAMYVDDRNGGVEEIYFNSAITIQDAVYPI